MSRASATDIGAESAGRLKAPSIRRQWGWVICGGLVLGMAMGNRNVQGLFMLPILGDRDWGREPFAYAMGLQMLVWGLLQPAAGWLCDRFGSGKVIAAGSLLYACGLWLEATATDPTQLWVGVGVLTGLGLTGVTFGAVGGGLMRMVPVDRRGWAQGVAGAVGGLIQFGLVPAAQWTLDSLGWSMSLQLLAALALACAAVGLVIEPTAPTAASSGPAKPSETVAVMPVVRQALANRSFWLLNFGFISCGFQLSYLGAHLPAFLSDKGMSAQAVVNSVAIIALANAFGAYWWGRMCDGDRLNRVLAGVYAVRTLAICGFLMLPASEFSLYAFSLVMGLVWLGTFPLTNSILAQIFGVRCIGTLWGLVFLGHQAGGFLGAWLGGYLYDANHNYDLMWTIAVALGVASVALNLPISSRSIAPRLEGDLA